VVRLLASKRALKPQQIWMIRRLLDRQGCLRDRARFDLAIDSKLLRWDSVKMQIGDVASDGRMRTRAIIIQQKTGKPVQFEIQSSYS
jgi:hypothetical protein